MLRYRKRLHLTFYIVFSCTICSTNLFGETPWTKINLCQQPDRITQHAVLHLPDSEEVLIAMGGQVRFYNLQQHTWRCGTTDNARKYEIAAFCRVLP